MSTFYDQEVACPACQQVAVHTVAHSINASRAPHMRQAIVDGTFQRVRCESCAAIFTIEWPFLYIDFDRKHWFGVFSEIDEPRFAELEDEPAEAYELCAGKDAPEAARAEAASMRVRTVFGFEALREKLLCMDAGLDDVSLELCKLALLSQVDADAGAEREDATAGLRLRLESLTAGELQFRPYLDGQMGEEIISLARSQYLDLHWRTADSSLRRAFAGRPFIDVQRLTSA